MKNGAVTLISPLFYIFFSSFFPIFYYITESTPWVSNAAGLNYPSLSLIVVTYIFIDSNTKLEIFQTYVLCGFLYILNSISKAALICIGKHLHPSYYSGIISGCMYSI